MFYYLLKVLHHNKVTIEFPDTVISALQSIRPAYFSCDIKSRSYKYLKANVMVRACKLLLLGEFRPLQNWFEKTSLVGFSGKQ